MRDEERYKMRKDFSTQVTPYIFYFNMHSHSVGLFWNGKGGFPTLAHGAGGWVGEGVTPVIVKLVRFCSV